MVAPEISNAVESESLVPESHDITEVSDEEEMEEPQTQMPDNPQG